MVESVENSPIVLAFAQLVILIANAYLFARQKNQAERRKPDELRLESLVQTAVLDASSAKREVELIEVGHYNALMVKYNEVLVELRDAQSKIRIMGESIASLSNKLASRERADRSAAKAAPQSGVEEPPEPGPGNLDDILRAHGMPLNAPPGSSTPAIPSTFGKKAR